MSDILKLQIEWFVSQPWVGTSEPVKLLSRARLFVTPWTTAHQAPLSMEFSRQVYWNGLPFPPSGDLPDLGITLGHVHCMQILYRLSCEGSFPILFSAN